MSPMVRLFFVLSLWSFAHGQHPGTTPPRQLGPVPLPEEVQGRLSSHLTVACSAEGSFIVPLTVGIEVPNPPLVRVSPTGAVLGRIDIEKGTGLGKAGVVGYAIGPDDAMYVLAREVYSEDIGRDAEGRVTSAGWEWKDPGWLLRFDAQGNFLAKQPLSFHRKMFGASLAVLPSGTIFVTTATPTRTRSAPGRPGQLRFLSGAFLLTKAGRRVDLEWPDTEEGGEYHLDNIDWPLVSGRELWVVRLGVRGAASFLFVFADNGQLLRRVKLDLAADTGPMMPRAWGGRLLVKSVRILSPPGPNRGSRFLELDIHTGAILADYTFPMQSMQPLCRSSAGAMFLGASPDSFDIFQPLSD